MTITVSTGIIMAIASTYGSSVNMTAITNAAEAVATLGAGHGVVVGDYLEVTSGWGRLNGRIVRAKTVATNDVTFEGINTVSTTVYPAGTGTGTIRRITAWTNLSQVKIINSSGGEQQFADITALDDVVGKQMPTIRSPVQMSVECFDDPTLPWYSAVATADDARIPYALRLSAPNSSKIVANAYWGLQRIPAIGTNEPLRTLMSLSFSAEPTRYAT
jgi:ribosomal protein L24